MTGIFPRWFAADQVFERRGGFYIGDRDGFSIGPYESLDAAHAEAADLRRELARTGSAREMVGVVTRLLERRQKHGERRPAFGRRVPARRGEPPGIGYRTPRLFALYGRWYVTTREGLDVGPYASREAADRAQHELVARLERCDSDRERWTTIADFMIGLHDTPG